MKRRHTILALLTATLLASCSQSDNLTDGPSSSDTDDVRILPAVGGRDFSVSIDETRSTGPFERWSQDEAHWRAADFHTFALLTHNFLGGQADFRLKSDVMYDQLMRVVNADGEVAFYDSNNPSQEVYRYYSNYRANRYKFFTYYADDALLDTLPSTMDSIRATVVIDGHQDLMHGFAYHTDQELADHVGLITDADQRAIFTDPLSNGGREYLYSGVAGNRGIHPRFHIHHLLSRFDVLVQGMVGANDAYSFLQVLVDSVAVVAPARGMLTIAADQWDDEATYNQAVADQSILRWGAEEKRYTLALLPTPSMTDGGYLGGRDFSSLQRELQNNGILTQDFHQVHSTEATPLCQPALLPATESGIQIRVYYHYIYTHWDEATGQWITNLDDIAQHGQWTNESTLAVRDSQGSPVRFRAGGKYTVLIKIYGPEEITASVAGLDEEQWTEEGYVEDEDLHD